MSLWERSRVVVGFLLAVVVVVVAFGVFFLEVRFCLFVLLEVLLRRCNDGDWRTIIMLFIFLGLVVLCCERWWATILRLGFARLARVLFVNFGKSD